MPNKKTVALDEEKYVDIITTIQSGGSGFRPNERIATILVLEANLGMRIGDILRLCLCLFIKDGSRYRIDIIEEKSGKKRTFTVPFQIYQYIENYCLRNDIGPEDRLFEIKERQVQAHLKKVCDYLGYTNIGTHSFRKFYATDIYNNNGHDIVLVQKLLQHSSPDITRRYIGISEEKIEEAIANHIYLL